LSRRLHCFVYATAAGARSGEGRRTACSVTSLLPHVLLRHRRTYHVTVMAAQESSTHCRCWCSYFFFTKLRGRLQLSTSESTLTIHQSPVNCRSYFLKRSRGVFNASFIANFPSRSLPVKKMQIDQDLARYDQKFRGMFSTHTVHEYNHRLRGSASPVVKVTSHFNGKLQNLTPCISQTP